MSESAIRLAALDTHVPAPSSTLQHRRLRGWNLLVAFIIASLILRWIALALVPLIPEEAYYWMYAKHPSLSYFDHPPMVAWVVRVGTAVFGDSEFGVRIFGNLLTCIAVVAMYGYARLWVGRNSARVAAILLLILPIYLWTGFINTMNSQLLFFWTLSLLGASLALRRNKWWGWYLAGFGFGGALLSKYTGVFVGGGLLVAMLLHRPWRKHLLSPHPYLAAVAGIEMFTPVLLWNYHHEWASFRFQFLDRAEAHPLRSWATLWSPVNFFLLQLVAVTPIFLLVCLQFFTRGKSIRRLLRRQQIVFAFSMALPMLAAMAWKSLRFDVHLDWTEPAYLGLFPLVARSVVARMRLSRRAGSVPFWSRYWNRSVAIALGACIGFNVGALLYLLVLQPYVGRPDVFGPWRVLASVVQKYECALEKETGQEPLIIGRGKYRLASELAFYRAKIELPASSSAYTTSQWFFGDVDGLGFPYWLDRFDWKGRDCIYVSDKDDVASVVRRRFDSVQFIDDPLLRGLPGGLTYHLAICRGFKG